MLAASTVVDVARIDISGMDSWEPFRMFLLMKEVRCQRGLSVFYECGMYLTVLLYMR